MIENIKTGALVVFWVLAMGGLIYPPLWLLLACAVFVSTVVIGVWATWALLSDQDY